MLAARVWPAEGERSDVDSGAAIARRIRHCRDRTRAPACGGDPCWMEGLTGIEPALSAWEAEVLPLNYSPVRHRRLASITNAHGNDAPLPSAPLVFAPSRRLRPLAATRVRGGEDAARGRTCGAGDREPSRIPARRHRWRVFRSHPRGFPESSSRRMRCATGAA
ncbi:hypothetical protein MICRO8M_10155 [Microbacterium sp. 8M]|nr:hypothetical protein MICRO8M_10155 [Microbacterium sp. 8M]